MGSSNSLAQPRSLSVANPSYRIVLGRLAAAPRSHRAHCTWGKAFRRHRRCKRARRAMGAAGGSHRPSRRPRKECMPSGEQLCAGWGELHIGAGLVQPKPALADREIKAGFVLRWRPLQFGQKRPVDQFDEDATSCTASTELVISTSLRAAASGLENGLSVAYFTGVLGINVSPVVIAAFWIVTVENFAAEAFHPRPARLAGRPFIGW